ncbi:hypothetical protein BC830DRAFT_756262 [Chytriomyces sp. MP71]|nr:hypothetical protein BC830DRAFT_756262 [Chytriomyces sp. MP71]
MLQRDPSPGNGPRSPRDPSALSSPCILNRAIPSAAFKTNTSYFASSVKTPSTQARARVGPAPTLPVTRMPDYLQPGQMSAGKRKAVYDRDAFEEEVETVRYSAWVAWHSQFPLKHPVLVKSKNSFNENKYASDDEKVGPIGIQLN